MALYKPGLRSLRRRHTTESSPPSPTRLDNRIWEYHDEVQRLANMVGDSNHGLYSGVGIFNSSKLLQYVQARNCHYTQENNLLQIGDLTMHPFKSSKGFFYVRERDISVPISLINAALDYATLESCVTELGRELQERGITRGRLLTEELKEDAFLALVQLDPNKLWAITTRTEAQDLLRRYKPITK